MNAADVPAGWDCHTHVFDARAVLPGSHYRPPVRDLASLEEEARRIGVGHCVLVQPSVYGTDNTLILDVLRASGGRHRGVAVIDSTVSGAELAEMHSCGVRGVRFNLVSPAGNDSAALEALAPQLRDLGWHVQWHAQPAHLPPIAELHRRHGLRCVLDHLAGFTPAAARDDSLLAPLLPVADLDAWVKLSGWYRLGAALPYEEIDAVVQRIANVFEGRCVWGSDWPHTRFFEPRTAEGPPPYADTWRPVVRALGAARAQRILCDDPVALYA